MFLHSQFKTITNIPKQTLYRFLNTIFLSIFLKFTKKNSCICTINNCKISSATLITIYTNLVKTKIKRILNLSVYFFTKLQKKKNHSKINIASILR